MLPSTRFPLLFISFLLCFTISLISTQYRGIDEGETRNKPLFRETPSSRGYSDNFNTINPLLPNARQVSNAVYSLKPANSLTDLPLTEFVTYWAQFINYDLLVLTPPSAVDAEPADIAVPAGDAVFDPAALGDRKLNYTRMEKRAGSGGSNSNPRDVLNKATQSLDGSMIYGSDLTTSNSLRQMAGGKLKTRTIGNSTFLPIDANGKYISGHEFVNINPALQALHTVFVREHNRLCDDFAARHPDWNDEKLFQEARKFVIAYIQSITFNEFLPAMLNQTTTYSGYSSTVGKLLEITFAATFGPAIHSAQNSFFKRLDDNRVETISPILLRDAFNKPATTYIEEPTTDGNVAGIDSILRGLAQQRPQKMDLYYVDDLRNFYMGSTYENGATDRAALDLQLGRDLGILGLNAARGIAYQDPLTSFNQLSSSNTINQIMQTLTSSTLSRVDATLGTLAEDPAPGSLASNFLRSLIINQFTKLQASDSFYYKNKINDKADTDGTFTQAEVDSIDQTLLAHVILRNTEISSLQCHLFSQANTPSGTNDYDCIKDTTLGPFSDEKSAEFLSGAYKVYWNLKSEKFMEFKIVAKTKGFVAFGFNSGQTSSGDTSTSTQVSMLNSDAIIGYFDEASNTAVVKDYYISGDRVVCSEGKFGVCTDISLGGADNVLQAQGSYKDGYTTLMFRRKLDTGDPKDVKISLDRPMPIILSMSASDSKSIEYHGANKASGYVDFVSGKTKLSRDVYNQRVTHGVFMTFGWSIMMVIGTFIARFFKKLFGKYWLQAHLFFQVSGIGFVLIGFVIAFMMTQNAGSSHMSTVHHWFGLLTVLSVLIQMAFGEFANMFFRSERKKPFVTEVVHWIWGYFIFFLSTATIFLGFGQFQETHIAIWIVYALWILAVIILWFVFQCIFGQQNRAVAEGFVKLEKAGGDNGVLSPAVVPVSDATPASTASTKPEELEEKKPEQETVSN